MTANRRGILALLGIGAVSAPTSLSSLQQSGISGVSGQLLTSGRRFSGYLEGDADAEDMSEATADSYDSAKLNDRYIKNSKESLDHASKRLKQMLEGKGDLTKLSEFIRDVEKLDSDLVSNRSLALNAKIRLQATRNLIRAQETEIESSKRSLYNTVKKAGKWLPESTLKTIMETHLSKHAKTVSFADIIIKAMKKG